MQPQEIDALIARIAAKDPTVTDADKLELLKQIDDSLSVLNLYLDEVRVQQLREQLEK